MRSLKVLAFVVAAALSPFAQAQKPAEISGAVGTAPGKGGAIAVVSESVRERATL